MTLAGDTPPPLRPLPARPHPHSPAVSPLMLADRLITLAQDADQAGYRREAEGLVTMVFSILEPMAADPPASAPGRRAPACEPALPQGLSGVRPVPAHVALPA